MSVAQTLLGLIEPEPSHGYQLKRDYDGLFGHDRPLPFGQMYTTLGRLQRDGLVLVDGPVPGDGPDRKCYAITDSGVTHLDRWLGEPEPPEPHLQTLLYTKVVLALLSDRPAEAFLDAQRSAHLARMAELTVVRRAGPLRRTLLADYGLFHLEADLRWIDMTAARLEQLGTQLATEVTR